jgi:hypothetical protein
MEIIQDFMELAMITQSTILGDKKRPGSPKGQGKPRSPSYPGINLRDAIARAIQVWNKDRRNEASEDTILGHWGYKPKSGLGLVILAALKAFGLLETTKTGGLKLTDLAVGIIVDTREDSLDRKAAIQVAAKKPAMHQIMWAKYGKELPSDPNIMFFLEKEKQFTASGAKQFIAQYKATLGFSHLLEDNYLSDSTQDETTLGEPPVVDIPAPGLTSLIHTKDKPSSATFGFKQVPIPIPGTAWPILVASFPMSEEAWNSMLEVLKAMKPGLVAKEDSTTSAEDEKRPKP